MPDFRFDDGTDSMPTDMSLSAQRNALEKLSLLHGKAVEQASIEILSGLLPWL